MNSSKVIQAKDGRCNDTKFLLFVTSARLVGWLCFTSYRQQDDLDTAPTFTVPYEGREVR